MTCLDTQRYYYLYTTNYELTRKNCTYKNEGHWASTQSSATCSLWFG